MLMPLENDNEHSRNIYKSLNKKKVFLFITESLIGSASSISPSTLAVLNPSAGLIISKSTDLLFSVAILITNEYISQLKIRYTELDDWINVITLLFEKTLKQSMID